MATDSLTGLDNLFSPSISTNDISSADASSEPVLNFEAGLEGEASYTVASAAVLAPAGGGALQITLPTLNLAPLASQIGSGGTAAAALLSKIGLGGLVTTGGTIAAVDR